MEKRHDDKLMKSRSYRRVITTALRLYTGSFRKVFKSTWLLATIFSLAAAVAGTLITTQLTTILLQMAALPEYKRLIAQEHWTVFLSTALLLLVAFALLVLFSAAVGNKLREHHLTGSISLPSRWFAAQEHSLLKSLKHMCKAARRHWLLTIGVLLAGCLVILPISVVMGLPALVLTTANLTAQSGTLLGDPLGMPSYMAWLSAATWFLAAFLQIYIFMILIYVGYYAYGSQETQQKEREQQKLSIQ